MSKEKDSIELYVLVSVSYDWYRFQHNIGVFRTKEEAIREANKLSDNYKTRKPICNKVQSKEMDNMEKFHWLIEEYNI